MAADVAQARAYWQQVAYLLDAGEAAESESAQVTLLATEMAVKVTDQAMQLHGGNGYTTERRVERYWRDVGRSTSFDDRFAEKAVIAECRANAYCRRSGSAGLVLRFWPAADVES